MALDIAKSHRNGKGVAEDHIVCQFDGNIGARGGHDCPDAGLKIDGATQGWEGDDLARADD